MKIIKIDNIEEKPVRIYGSLPDRVLRAADANGIFIAESPKVIRVALEHGYRPLSMLCEEKHIHGDAAPLLPLCPEDMPVYTGERATLSSTPRPEQSGRHLGACKSVIMVIFLNILTFLIIFFVKKLLYQKININIAYL